MIATRTSRRHISMLTLLTAWKRFAHSCVMMMLSSRRSTKLQQSDQQRFSTLLKVMRRSSMLNAMVVEASLEMHNRHLGGRPKLLVTLVEQSGTSKPNANSSSSNANFARRMAIRYHSAENSSATKLMSHQKRMQEVFLYSSKDRQQSSTWQPSMRQLLECGLLTQGLHITQPLM